MSPEQVRGDKLDGRTDLFSFGLVLYEMATGHQAFTGETAEILRSVILERMPVPSRSLNPNISPELDGMIQRALKKEREARPQTASEMLTDLEGLRRDLSSRASAIRRSRPAAVLVLLLFSAVFLWLIKHEPSPSPLVPELKQQQLTLIAATIR